MLQLFALILNDKFLANYALFFVDDRFDPKWDVEQNVDNIKSVNSFYGAFAIQAQSPQNLPEPLQSYPLPDGRVLTVSPPRF